MAITERITEEQNPSQAPTLGMGAGTFGQQAQQRSNIAQGGSGRFTNLQSYIKANESNPNAQLLQREGQRKQEELGTRQQEFTQQATPIKQQFEGIRSGQQFVQSALQDPTKVVADPTQLQRFTQYRTQGLGDVQQPFSQLQGLRGTLGTQQEQLASGLETIQNDPNALQNFIQSQRMNPSTATRGENVLDRFLTQSTESGQKAISGLGETANVIRGTEAPRIIGDIEGLKGQVETGALTGSDVSNLLGQAVKPEEEFLNNLNNQYIAQQVGLGGNTRSRTFSDLEDAQAVQQNIDNYNKRIQELNNIVTPNTNELNDLNDRYRILEQRRSVLTDQEREEANNNRIRARELENAIGQKPSELNNLLKGLQAYSSNSNNIALIQKLQNYNNQLGKSRQDILQQYDPTRLSRIQALQQLAGTTQFNPLLQTRVL